MDRILFKIRDLTGHSQRLVPPEQANDVADQLRDQGYRIFAGKRLIPYGDSVMGFGVIEAIPIAAGG